MKCGTNILNQPSAGYYGCCPQAGYRDGVGAKGRDGHPMSEPIAHRRLTFGLELACYMPKELDRAFGKAAGVWLSC